MESLELKKGEKPKKKKIVKNDFKIIAEYIFDEQRKREKSDKRKALDAKIKEVDRQVAMRPNTTLKMNADGTPDRNKAWMSELEIPNQRQTLELLNADARRLLWPDTGSWFDPHTQLTDEYLSRVENLSLILGDENETKSSVNQEIADEIAEAWLLNQHRSYRFRDNVDIINSESFKYGTGIGRAKNVETKLFGKTLIVPQLVPRSIKFTYLDGSKYSLLNEGINIESPIISKSFMRWEDLVIASNKGSNDPDDENGGWMPAMVKEVEPEKDDMVELLEFEGDLVVARSSESIYVPNVIVTAAMGQKEPTVVRLRFRKSERNSYFLFPYHHEDIEDPYAVGPLIMGHPIQSAASHALNRAMDSATYATDPHIFYDSDDPDFAAQGGPVLTPGGSSPRTGDIDEVSPGDPGALFNIYLGLMAQYAELTGVTGPRLGAETKSHTTAFSKDQEITRGQVRTVDYVKSVMQGPLGEWLQYSYETSRELLSDDAEVPVYMPKSQSFAKLSKEALPEHVFFDIYGASGPAEDAAKIGAQIQALNTAIGIETAKAQLGSGEPLDLTAVQKEFLRKGGLIDVDKFYVQGIESVPAGATGSPELGAPTGGGIENAAPAAIQALLQRQ